MASSVLASLSARTLFDLHGVVAVVTGGGTGIGLMIARTLVANGANVYIVGPRQADLDRIAKTYNDAEGGEWGKMYGIEGDVSQKSEALRIAAEVAKREPHVTVLFNNAGILQGPAKKPVAPTAEAFIDAYFNAVEQEHFDNVLNTNAVGPYWLTFAFLPLLEKWKAEQNPLNKRFVPQVIMTSSMNGWTKDPATGGNSFPYLFSKSALGHATSSLAHELLPLGIRVNGIAPGWFQTEMSAPGTIDALGNSHYPEGNKIGFEVPTVPTGGTNKDMGSLVLMLMVNWFVNGETVLIDGGTMLKHPSSY